jgi:hypothetical protein
MTRQCGRWMPALTMVAVLCASGSSQAQDLRRDVMSNGVLIGAGTGAASGAVLGLVAEEICSPGACALLAGVTGGLIGLVVDRNIGHPRPVAAGSFIDDGLGNGALIGALGGMGIVLFDASLHCGPQPDRVPCTRKGIMRDILLAARWMAIVGLVVDAAIPSRLEGPGSVQPGRSQRRLGVGVNLRF